MTTDETLERLDGLIARADLTFAECSLAEEWEAAVREAATLIRSLRDERDSWRRVAERLESTIQTRALEQKATAP